jgi:SAM-dependent methyltransferase
VKHPTQTEPDKRWNHNIHYFPLALAAIPPGCERALDVGCGEGMLVRQLARRVPYVVGIDEDATSIDLARQESLAQRQGLTRQQGLARQRSLAGQTAFVRGDFLSNPFPSGSFGLVTCVAALHHMDPLAALTTMSGLLAPGGVLVVVGLARPALSDRPREAAAVFANIGYRLARGYWEHRPPLSGRPRTPTPRSAS